MSWLQRHLNWTLLIALLGGYALYFLSIPIMAAAEGPELFLLSLAILIIGLTAVSGWALKQKGRSLFNLFWLSLGLAVGVIIFMCMQNKRRESKEEIAKKEKEREEGVL